MRIRFACPTCETLCETRPEPVFTAVNRGGYKMSTPLICRECDTRMTIPAERHDTILLRMLRVQERTLLELIRLLNEERTNGARPYTDGSLPHFDLPEVEEGELVLRLDDDTDVSGRF